MSFVLYFYHGTVYLWTASDPDALCNEGVVVQWNAGMEIEWLGVGEKVP